MDLSRYIKIGLRWWWLVVLSMLLSAGMSYWYSQRLPKIYSARTTLAVGSNILENPNPDVRSLTSIVTLAQVYAELAKRPPVAQAVIDKLGLDLPAPQLGGMIETTVIPNAQLLEIYVMDVNPKRAQLLANTIAEELILQSPTGAQGQQQRETFIHSQLSDLQVKIEDTDQKIKELKDTLPGLTSAVEIAEAQSTLTGLERLKSEYQLGYNQFLANLSDASINRLAIFETAIEPTEPISPDIILNVLIATAAGMVLAVTAIILLEFFDDALVWQPGKTQTVLGLPVLGAVTKMAGGQIIGAQDKLWSSEADMLRTLRSSILLAAEGRPLSTLLITSSSPGEGKSFLAANLATTAATPGSSMASVLFSPGSRVILVDADLRKPGLHEDFDMPNLLGLADVLAVPEAVTEKLIEKALKPTGIDSLLLLPAGRTPLDPGALLNSPRLVKVLEHLKTRADLVIIDSAPLLDVVETKAIANAVDGVVLIIYEGRSRGKNLKRIVEYFEGKSHNNLLGVVFNGVKLSTYGYSSYTYRPQIVSSQPSFWRRVTPFGRQPSAESEIITIAEVADQLGISQEMARRWCEDGRIPASRSGRQWVVRLEDLNDFISVYQQGSDSGEAISPRKGSSIKGEGVIREKQQRADERQDQTRAGNSLEGNLRVQQLDGIMSGVFGIIDRKRRMNLSETTHSMVAAMSHYPWFVAEYTTDDEQAIVLGRIGIGIFNQEAQPIWNSRHTIALVMTGEFYNQDSLSKDIVSKAMSDEQIALAMYEQYGEDFACYLRGTFIIAVWDMEQQRVIITNDRFGLYPLYYTYSKDKLAFAPEVKAVLADHDFCKRLDMVALAEYIRFQCLLGDKTFFEGLQLLPNASVFVYSLETGSLTLHSYWDISHLPSLPATLTFNEAVKEAGRLLKAAIDRRTSRPQRLGLYLSAGVDSRVILGLIDRELFSIPTITFGQRNCRDVIYAQKLAKKAGTQHHYFEFYDGKWVEEFADLHLVLTEGFHSWIHAHGISFLSQVRPLLDVNLTGFGGGQSAIDWEDLSLLEAQDDTAFSNRLFTLLCQNTTWPSVSEAEAKSLFTPALAKEMDELVFSSFKAELAKFQHLPYYQRAAYFALCNPDRRLFQYYTVFHRSHFEQRFPFYDYPYFEFVYALPSEMLFRRKLRRAIILEKTPALAHIPYDKDDLPITNNSFFRLASKIARRSKKWINDTISPVFPTYATLYADYENWLRHELREWGESILLGERTLQRGFFNPEALRSLWRRHQSGLELHTIGKIAPIMTYEMMLRKFYDE